MANDKLSLHLDTSYYIEEPRRKQLLLTNTSSRPSISAVARDGAEEEEEDGDGDGDGDGDDDVWELEARILSEECKLMRVEKELELLRRRSGIPRREPGHGFWPVQVEEVCFLLGFCSSLSFEFLRKSD
jgi:hypothetical protein